MTAPQNQIHRLSLRFSELRLAACLLVVSSLLLFGRELAMSFPGGPTGPATRLGISVVLAWGLLRSQVWAWWASALIGGLWLLMDFMFVATMFAFDLSLEPLYEWPLFPLVGAFIAQAVAMGLLLHIRWRLPFRLTLGALLVTLVLVVLGFARLASSFESNLASAIDTTLAQNGLSDSIYSSVAERVKTPAIKVWIGTKNGVKGVRIVIADSSLVSADSARQAAPAQEIAKLVRSVLPAHSELEFIGIGWSLDTGPGVMPLRMHTFSVNELGHLAADAQ